MNDLTNGATALLAGAEAATKTEAPAAPKVSITLDAFVFGILKKKALAGEAAFKKHIATMAAAYDCETVEVVATYESMVAAEAARVAAEAKNKRIVEKKTKSDAWVIANLNTFTVPKSVITLLEKAREHAKTLCDADSQVTMVPMFGLNEKGEPTVTLSSTGLSTSGTAPRASTGDGTRSEKSRISPWVAYQDGCKKGDAFRISKVATGKFRDESRNEDIPNKGFTKWVRSYYADSHTAAILKGYGQL